MRGGAARCEKTIPGVPCVGDHRETINRITFIILPGCERYDYILMLCNYQMTRCRIGTGQGLRSSFFQGFFAPGCAACRHFTRFVTDINMKTTRQINEKKPAANQSLQQAPPLRHIGHIVIWEGNYKPDINNIGQDGQNFNREKDSPACYPLCSNRTLYAPSALFDSRSAFRSSRFFRRALKKERV